MMMDEKKKQKIDEIDSLYDAVLGHQTTHEFIDMLFEICKLRCVSPYNAMMVEFQKPGSLFVATPRRWARDFHRLPKAGARPLVILQPFGPIAFVYDYSDTEDDGSGYGIKEQELLEEFAHPFRTNDVIGEAAFQRMKASLLQEGILYGEESYGNLMGGCIGEANEKVFVYETKKSRYYVKASARINVNTQLSLTEKYATVLHELGHYFCGHLGQFSNKKIPERYGELSKETREFEAETAAWLCCKRLGIQTQTEDYLVDFVGKENKIPPIRLSAILTAAGKIESLLSTTDNIRRDIVIRESKETPASKAH